ncbi:MAG: replication-relaxation family protein [Fuerstiella sp.]
MPMILQPRDIRVLSHFARYFMLTSRQVRELEFSGDTTGRATRRRLTLMAKEGYLRKRNLYVVNPKDGAATPVYHLDRTGRDFLAGHFDDDCLRLLPIEPSQPQHLYHYVAVAESHRIFDQAITVTSEKVTIPRWYNEDEIINPEVERAGDRRYLRTDFNESPKVVCIPDAAFLVEYNRHKIAIYLEQDRDSFFHDRVAARKSRGYERLLASKGHRRHFPDSTVDFFYVMFIAPTSRRADQLCRAFKKRNGDSEAAKVYRFASLNEITPNDLLFEPVLRHCHRDEKVSLITRIE